MSLNWLCGRRPARTGCPVVFLQPLTPVLLALWALVLGKRRLCYWDRCIHPCPLEVDHD